jgi:TRAP transporter TAXI family solute receptor
MTGFIARLGLAAALATGLAASATAQGRITIGTNPQGTFYYAIGGGFAAKLQEALGRPATVQPMTGSSVYIPLVAAGELTLGLNSAIDLGGFYNGEYDGKPLKNLRVLARLFPLRQAFATRANDNLVTIGDLKGKRVVTAFSSLAAIGKVDVAMLLAGGLSEADVDGVTVSGLKSGLDGLTDGSLDATGIAIGIPLTQEAHATIPGGIRYVSITGDKATREFIGAFYPGVYLTVVNPTPRMPEVSEPITIAAYDVFVSTSAELSDEEATAILTVLWDALDQLKTDYPAMGSASHDLMADPSNTAPYHPAAAAFFKTKGVWSAENDLREAELAQ